jgi:hypothetical protein
LIVFGGKLRLFGARQFPYNAPFAFFPRLLERVVPAKAGIQKNIPSPPMGERVRVRGKDQQQVAG